MLLREREVSKKNHDQSSSYSQKESVAMAETNTRVSVYSRDV